MGEVITNLKAKFSVDSQNVGKGLKPGQDALVDLDRKVEKSIGGLKNMLTPLALLGGAGGAFVGLKRAIESVEGPGDRLDAIMGGLKESFFEAGRALGTMNFSDFLKSIEQGYERGVMFTQMLDELQDRAAYNDYRINQYKRESEELREVVKDRTKDIAARGEAAAKVLEIEDKIKQRRQQLAQEEFNLQKQMWEGRNKMETFAALALYEQIDSMAPQLKERLQKVFQTSFDAARATMGSGKASEYAIEIITRGLQSGDATLYQEVPKEVIDSYAEYFRLVENGEKDVLIKLFNTYKQIEEVSSRAQADYNSAVTETTQLLKQEEDALKGVANAAAEKTNKEVEAQAKALEALKKSNAPGGKKDLYLPQTEGVNMQLRQMGYAFVDTTNLMREMLEDNLSYAMNGFSQWLGEFAVGASSFQNLGRLVGSALGDMLIQLGTTAIKTGIGIEAIKDAFKTLNGLKAIAVGVTLVAFGAAIKSSVQGIPDRSNGSGTGPGSYTFDNRQSQGGDLYPMKVVVKGELKLKNNVLVAALENENRRKKEST